MNFFGSGTDDDARERVRALLASSFDVPKMAEYALARAWEQANAEQREELLAASGKRSSRPFCGACGRGHEARVRRVSQAGGKRAAGGEPPDRAGQARPDLDLVA
ncbi:ABC transporter substrate-binding protein [Methyloceanibacter superfactus]|uniref:ABC transporter substrate-binding protein n=1 Tax=Methyloceanibacter superfactus TaxID=1774969 RepID=UPI00114CE943